ncbi:TOMM precursor leader peptide-binding protein, partial [Nonomuraea rhizosphaerae]|uniref:TOMM precursor leader peptide-binding protein n=1 Tax=Nonomuraea rhizosphaerae TaxID=2665663 RepID=UPI001C5F6904
MTELSTGTRSGTGPRRVGVAVLGAGRVAEAVAAGGDGRMPFVAVESVAAIARMDDCAAIVVVSSGAGQRRQAAVQEYASPRRLSWLPVRVDSGWITIGPLVRPPRPGCPVCVQRRQARNRRDAAARRLLREHLGPAPEQADDSMVAPMLAAAVARLVRSDLGACSGGPAGARTG